jgi:hypothetical protein
MNCLQCTKETVNPKFCSMSCAAKFNNASNPKRVLSKKCKTCPTKIRSNRSYCKSCRAERLSCINKTLGQMIAGSKKNRRASIYVNVRNHAKYLMKKWCIPKKCTKCGYNKHAEVCHLKAISSFPETTLISVINDKSNLTYLCPNCHWEMDNL